MFESYRFVWPFVKTQKKRYFIGILCSFIDNMLSALPIYLVGVVVDLLAQGNLTLKRVGFYMGVVTLASILIYISGFIWTVALYGSYSVAQKFYQDHFISVFLKRRQIFYEKFNTGDLMSRATLDVEYIADLISWGVQLLFSTGFNIVLYLVLMIQKGGLTFSLITIIPYLILMVLSHFRDKEVDKRWQERQEAFSRMNDRVLEGVEGVRHIRAFAQEEAFRQRFHRQTHEFSDLANRTSVISNTYSLTTAIAATLVFLLTMSVGSYRVVNGQMTIGDLISFQIFVTYLANPLANFAMNINVIKNANISSKRIKEVWNFDDQMEKGEVVIQSFANVKVKDYSFAYPSSEQKNLDHIALELHKGQVLGMCGKTGSGKSCFLQQFLREYPAGEGTFELNGVALADIKPGGLYPILSYVTQDHYFFSGTIRENVLFSVGEASDEAIMKALEWAHFDIGDEVIRDGLDTLIGERGISLSGGQRQRLSLARALLKDPDLLILDDSLSAVDQVTEQAIVRNLRQIRQGKTTIISSHRLSALTHANQIVVFDRGKIAEKGTHQDLMALGGWYHDQFLHQEERA